jgi:hypothetical protein
MSEVLLLTSGMRVHADGCQIGTTVNSRAIAGNTPCPTGEHHDGRDPATDLTGARRITTASGPKRPPARRSAAVTPAPRRDAPGRAAALVGNRPSAPVRRAAAPQNRAPRPLSEAERVERDLVASVVADGLGVALAGLVPGGR